MFLYSSTLTCGGLRVVRVPVRVVLWAWVYQHIVAVIIISPLADIPVDAKQPIQDSWGDLTAMSVTKQIHKLEILRP